MGGLVSLGYGNSTGADTSRVSPLDETSGLNVAKDAVVRGSGASRPWMACARLLEPGTAQPGDAPVTAPPPAVRDPVPAAAGTAKTHASHAMNPRTPTELRSDTKLVNLLRSAVEAVADDHGWAFLGAVGTQIANRASFDSRNYGYRKLSDLVVASGLFEIRRQELAIHLRDKRHPEARGTRAGATAAE